MDAGPLALASATGAEVVDIDADRELQVTHNSSLPGQQLLHLPTGLRSTLLEIHDGLPVILLRTSNSAAAAGGAPAIEFASLAEALGTFLSLIYPAPTSAQLQASLHQIDMKLENARAHLLIREADP